MQKTFDIGEQLAEQNCQLLDIIRHACEEIDAKQMPITAALRRRMDHALNAGRKTSIRQHLSIQEATTSQSNLLTPISLSSQSSGAQNGQPRRKMDEEMQPVPRHSPRPPPKSPTEPLTKRRRLETIVDSSMLVDFRQQPGGLPTNGSYSLPDRDPSTAPDAFLDTIPQYLPNIPSALPQSAMYDLQTLLPPMQLYQPVPWIDGHAPLLDHHGGLPDTGFCQVVSTIAGCDQQLPRPAVHDSITIPQASNASLTYQFPFTAPSATLFDGTTYDSTNGVWNDVQPFADICDGHNALSNYATVSADRTQPDHMYLLEFDSRAGPSNFMGD